MISGSEKPLYSLEKNFIETANFVPQRKKLKKKKKEKKIRALKIEPCDLVTNKRKGALEFQ